MTQSMEWEIDKDEKQGHRKKKILTQHLPAQGILALKDVSNYGGGPETIKWDLIFFKTNFVHEL